MKGQYPHVVCTPLSPPTHAGLCYLHLTFRVPRCFLRFGKGGEHKQWQQTFEQTRQAYSFPSAKVAASGSHGIANGFTVDTIKELEKLSDLTLRMHTAPSPTSATPAASNQDIFDRMIDPVAEHRYTQAPPSFLFLTCHPPPHHTHLPFSSPLPILLTRPLRSVIRRTVEIYQQLAGRDLVTTTEYVQEYYAFVHSFLRSPALRAFLFVCDWRLIGPEMVKEFVQSKGLASRKTSKGGANAGSGTRKPLTVFVDWLSQRFERLFQPVAGASGSWWRVMFKLFLDHGEGTRYTPPPRTPARPALTPRPALIPRPALTFLPFFPPPFPYRISLAACPRLIAKGRSHTYKPRVSPPRMVAAVRVHS
jgi:hypothetical protein